MNGNRKMLRERFGKWSFVVVLGRCCEGGMERRTSMDENHEMRQREGIPI